ncbi:MAG: hypothetical protein ABH843_04485, partial [Candidatus Omnitrophota bacterium]
LKETDRMYQSKRVKAEEVPEQNKQKQAKAEKVKSKQSDKDSSSFNLTGIIYDPEDAVAVIDEVYVKVGDSIGGAKVISINETSVILSRDNRQIVLNLE